MSKSSKKEKKKLRKRQKIESEIKADNIAYDILNLLATERIDSKPNLGKFLQSFVKDIRVFNAKKINMYPEFKYDIAKIFVTFLDGHELIKDCNANKSPGFETPEYYMYFNCDEIELSKKKDIDLVRDFFDRLVEFKFVF